MTERKPYMCEECKGLREDNNKWRVAAHERSMRVVQLEGRAERLERERDEARRDVSNARYVGLADAAQAVYQRFGPFGPLRRWDRAARAYDAIVNEMKWRLAHMREQRTGADR